VSYKVPTLDALLKFKISNLAVGVIEYSGSDRNSDLRPQVSHNFFSVIRVFFDYVVVQAGVLFFWRRPSPQQLSPLAATDMSTSF